MSPGAPYLRIDLTTWVCNLLMQVLDYITNGPLCQPGGMAVQKQPSGKRSRSQQGEEDLDDEEDEENEEAMGAAEQQLLSAPDGSKPKRHGGGNTRARAAWLLQNFKAELGKLAAAHTAGRVDLTFAPNSLTEQVRKAAADAAAAEAAREQLGAGYTTPETGLMQALAAVGSSQERSSHRDIIKKAAKLRLELEQEGAI